MVEYEGKAKQLIPTDVEGEVVQRFKDSATAFNGQKKAEIAGKGVTNNAISAEIFRRLEAAQIPTHFLAVESPRDMRVRRLSIIPLEVVVRNVVAGSLHKRLGLEEGQSLEGPIIETYYKRDDLGDPLVNDAHIAALHLCSAEDLDELRAMALRVNEVLLPWFASCGLLLVDFKLEFGRDVEGVLYLGDEISPDTCRIWDAGTLRKLDKDVFRRELGDVMDGYYEVARRLGVQISHEE
jgi:phosphoribosylaminoimidazole-succinocarboxamide synthase